MRRQWLDRTFREFKVALAEPNVLRSRMRGVRRAHERVSSRSNRFGPRIVREEVAYSMAAYVLNIPRATAIPILLVVESARSGAFVFLECRDLGRPVPVARHSVLTTQCTSGGADIA